MRDDGVSGGIGGVVCDSGGGMDEVVVGAKVKAEGLAKSGEGETEGIAVANNRTGKSFDGASANVNRAGIGCAW